MVEVLISFLVVALGGLIILYVVEGNEHDTTTRLLSTTRAELHDARDAIVELKQQVHSLEVDLQQWQDWYDGSPDGHDLKDEHIRTENA